MPRVLHVLPHLGGGAETYIDMLADRGRHEHERFALSASRAWALAPLSIAPRLAVLARRAHGFDVLHAHGDMAAMLALPVLRRHRAVWAPQGLHFLRRARGPRLRLAEAGLRRVIAGTARTLCSSEAEVDDLCPLAGADADRLTIVDNGVPLPPWPPAADQRERDRAALGLAGDAVAAVYLGQLEPRKDPLTVVRAVEQVEGLSLLVAGDGPLRAEVEAHAGPRIRVLGHTDPAPVLRAADVFLMPSEREGQSFAVLEGMANGLAMVVSDGSGNPEAVGDAGVVVPVGDVAAWTAALARLADDPAERARMQRAARERAETRFDPSRFRDAVESVYDELIASS